MDDAAGGECGARRAVEYDGAAIHHDDTADFICELVNAVFDHDDRRTVLAIEARKHGEHLCHTGGVEVGGGFVEHKQARTRGKDGCYTDALLLTARQFEDRPIAEVRKTDKFQRPGLFRQNFRSRSAKIFKPEADFVADPRIDDLGIGILEDHADIGCEGRNLGIGHRFSADSGRPLQCAAEKMGNGAVEKMQQGAFAAAARAKDQHEFTFPNCKVNIVENGLGFALIGVGDARKIDQMTRAGCIALAFVAAGFREDRLSGSLGGRRDGAVKRTLVGVKGGGAHRSSPGRLVCGHDRRLILGDRRTTEHTGLGKAVGDRLDEDDGVDRAADHADHKGEQIIRNAHVADAEEIDFPEFAEATGPGRRRRARTDGVHRR